MDYSQLRLFIVGYDEIGGCRMFKRMFLKTSLISVSFFMASTLLSKSLSVDVNTLNGYTFKCKDQEGYVVFSKDGITSTADSHSFREATIEETYVENDLTVIVTNKSAKLPDLPGGRAEIRITLGKESSGKFSFLRVEHNEGIQSFFHWYRAIFCLGDDVIVEK